MKRLFVLVLLFAFGCVTLAAAENFFKPQPWNRTKPAAMPISETVPLRADAPWPECGFPGNPPCPDQVCFDKCGCIACWCWFKCFFSGSANLASDQDQEHPMLTPTFSPEVSRCTVNRHRIVWTPIFSPLLKTAQK